MMYSGQKLICSVSQVLSKPRVMLSIKNTPTLSTCIFSLSLSTHGSLSNLSCDLRTDLRASAPLCRQSLASPLCWRGQSCDQTHYYLRQGTGATRLLAW